MDFLGLSGPRNALPSVDKMPLADIVHVNLDPCRLDADYKHGLHFTALPTAWVSGFDKTAELRIGSSTGWVADSVGAVAGFMESGLVSPAPHFMAARRKTARWIGVVFFHRARRTGSTAGEDTRLYKYEGKIRAVPERLLASLAVQFPKIRVPLCRSLHNWVRRHANFRNLCVLCG